MRPPLAVLLSIVMCVAFVFSSAASPAAPADKTAGDAKKGKTLTFYHWWAVPYEVAAVNALIHVFEKKYPDITVVTALEPNGGGASKNLFPVLRALVQAGNAPDAFQMHPGYEAQSFLDARLLGTTDHLWQSEELEKVVPTAIQEMCKSQGHYYSVPVGVHRTNVVWYNKAVLDKAGIDPATLTTWDAFFKASDQLRTARVTFPVEVGIGWTVAHVFECIMASLGMPAYEDWANGKITSADDARLKQALTILGKYLTYTNRTHYTYSFDDAMKRVVSGQSAFCIMGDWAQGAFRSADLKYGKDYGFIPVPGTKGMYGLTIDTFQRPSGIADTENSDRWLKVVVSKEGQDAFNSLKGSIPARNDTDMTAYDAYQKAAMADFRAAKSMYPSSGIGVPESYKLRFIEIMSAFSEDRDADKAAAALVAATTAVSKQYKRVWSLK
jgi:glucose/mannose transport system substrate-binding protein